MSRLVRFTVVLLTCTLALVIGACGSDEDSGLKGVALPSDFPSDQVPLIDGTVLTASGDATKGWSVTVQAPASDSNVLDTAVKKLTDAGYTESQRTSQNGQSVVVRINDRGPYVSGRCLDLSPAAFSQISSLSAGVADVTYAKVS